MDGLKLINPEQTIQIGDAIYTVHNATLEKVILFQAYFNKLTDAKDPAVEKKVAAYCLFLILQGANPAIPSLTEEWVQQNAPDLEMADIVEQFAFMSRQKVALLRGILQRNAPELEKAKGETTGASSST